jgi:hypothetical protein
MEIKIKWANEVYIIATCSPVGWKANDNDKLPFTAKRPSKAETVDNLQKVNLHYDELVITQLKVDKKSFDSLMEKEKKFDPFEFRNVFPIRNAFADQHEISVWSLEELESTPGVFKSWFICPVSSYDTESKLLVLPWLEEYSVEIFEKRLKQWDCFFRTKTYDSHQFENWKSVCGSQFEHVPFNNM